MNISDITINDMGVSIDADYSVSYTWTASYESSRRLVIQISTSDVFEGTETLSVSFTNWKTFRGEYGGCVQPDTVTSSIPNSLESAVEAAEDGSFITSIIMYSGVAINVILVAVLGGSLETMWSLLNCLQIVSFFPLMTSYFPAHVQVMFNMLSFANMEIEIFSEIFVSVLGVDGLTIKPYNNRFEDNEIESTIFFDN